MKRFGLSVNQVAMHAGMDMSGLHKILQGEHREFKAAYVDALLDDLQNGGELQDPVEKEIWRRELRIAAFIHYDVYKAVQPRLIGMMNEEELAAIVTEYVKRQYPLLVDTYDKTSGQFPALLPIAIADRLLQGHPTFEFVTVTLDALGRVKRRRKRHARPLVEELAPGVVIEMVEVPGGTFTMGAPKTEQGSHDDERPPHRVTVSPLHIGKFTVTQAQWRVVAGWPKVGRSLNAHPSYFKGDDRPVEQVSWEDAVEFCNRLRKKSGKAYRLPTEAEWEYACRAGRQTPFAFGETITPEFVNYDGNYPYGEAPKGECRRETIPVGSLGVANGFGLYDMHGNVWEWCQDWSGPYQSEPATDPQGPSQGTSRRLRGGSWGDLGVNCRSASRALDRPAFRYDNFGVRVAVVSRTP